MDSQDIIERVARINAKHMADFLEEQAVRQAKMGFPFHRVYIPAGIYDSVDSIFRFDPLPPPTLQDLVKKAIDNG